MVTFCRSDATENVFTEQYTSSRSAKSPEIIGGPSQLLKYREASSARPIQIGVYGSSHIISFVIIIVTNNTILYNKHALQAAANIVTTSHQGC